jgi:hypothetical protein
MHCGACGPTSNIVEMNMYKTFEAKVLADEAEKKENERDRRVSLGLPPEEGEMATYPAIHRRDSAAGFELNEH